MSASAGISADIANPPPLATAAVAGVVKPDGTTITNTSGAISVTYGAVANTASQGNDSRITGAAQQTGIAAWTPTDNSGASLTFTGVSVNYTRIGNLVFAYGSFTYPTTASGAGASIAGLPVPVAAPAYATVPAPVFVSGATSGVLIRATSGTSTALFLSGTTNAVVSNAILSGTSINFILIYPAT